MLQIRITKSSLDEFYRQLPDKPVWKEHRRYIKYAILRKLHLASIRKQNCSSHFSIHRCDMERVNGYDENFVGWGGEDEDIALRFAKAGFTGYSVIRETRVLHLWHLKEMGDRHWKEGPNIPYLTRKEIPYYCENGLFKKSAQ